MRARVRARACVRTGIRRNTKEYKIIQHNTKEYERIQGNTKEYTGIQGNTKEYQGIQRNIGGAQRNTTENKGMQPYKGI